MADFVVQQRPWYLAHTGVLIGDHTAPKFYLQDMIGGSRPVNRTQARHVKKHAEPSLEYKAPVVDVTIQEALVWPVSSVRQENVLPFVVFALSGLYLVPMFIPDTGIGASLSAGYASGVAAYYFTKK